MTSKTEKEIPGGNTENYGNDSKNPKYFGVRHTQVILMFMCVMIGFLMRVNMSVAIIAMTDISNTTNSFQTFKWDEKMKNVILSSFFWGYTLMQIPSAYLAHKFGAKILLLCALLLNGLTTILIPWGSKIGDWQMICACRVIQGLTQASLFPCVHTLLSKWIPHNERSRLSNIVFAGTPIGTIVGLPMSSMLASSSYGWPSIFYVIGILGILASVLWYFCGADGPGKHPTISNDEKDYIENSLKGVETKKVLKTPWKSMFTSLPVLALAFAHIGCNWGFLTLLVETPSYLKYALGIDIKSSGFLSALPYLAMWIGSILLSFLSDYLVNKKILTPTVSRKIFNTIGTWLPAIGLVILAYIPPGHEIVAVATITILVGLSSGMNMGFLMNNIDLAPNFAGILISITNCIANCIGILAPITVGFILKNEEDIKEWRAVFFISAIIYFGTNLFFIVFGTSQKQPWNEPVNVTDSEDGKVEKNSEEMKSMLNK